MQTLHEIISELRFETEQEPKIDDEGNMSFRIPKDVKEEASKICKQNTISLSAFLRRCCVNLVNEYK